MADSSLNLALNSYFLPTNEKIALLLQYLKIYCLQKLMMKEITRVNDRKKIKQRLRFMTQKMTMAKGIVNTLSWIHKDCVAYSAFEHGRNQRQGSELFLGKRI